MKRIQKNDNKKKIRKTETKWMEKYQYNEKYRYAGTELTRDGWIFCMTAGILETFSLLAACRIDLMYVPILVFLVLWAAFGIITSVFLVGTGYCMVCRRSIKKHFCAVIKQNLILIPDQRAVWNVKKAS